jgi:hypothetical protein
MRFFLLIFFLSDLQVNRGTSSKLDNIVHHAKRNLQVGVGDRFFSLQNDKKKTTFLLFVGQTI